MLTDMQNTKKTAGETAKKQTKPAWGIVSLIGMFTACTFGGSLIITGISTAMFLIGAYMGGYMEETLQKLRNNLASPAEAVERRAA